jgi:hypothetical protein
MKEKAENNSVISRAKALYGILAVQKKKSITAGCLLIVMTLMWGRIFLGKSPADASAGQDQIIPAEQSSAAVGSIQQNASVSFIELPKIEGRNDRLTRDFFAINGGSFRQFGSAKAAGAINDKIVKRIKTLLKVDATVSGVNPQAFINNKLYKTGNKIDISDGNQMYECVIEKISQTEVLIDCAGTKIKLELANPSEVIEQ